MLEEIAKLGAEKAFEFLGGSIFESKTCQDGEKQPLAISTFCKIIGGASGAGEDQWRKDVTERLERIQVTLNDIKTKLEAINTAVDSLMLQLKLVALELKEMKQGQLADKYIQQIQARYDHFTGLVGDSKRLPEIEDFFSDVLDKYDFPDHLEVIKTALTVRSPNNDSLFRTFARRIVARATAEKMSEEQILRLYDTFETYLTRFLIEMKKGYLLYTLATVYFDIQAQLKPERARKRRKTVASWAAGRDASIRDIVYNFNAEVMWLIVTLSREQLGGLRSYSLIPAAAKIAARALRFTARTLNEPYGLRGVVLSVGNKFNGQLTLFDSPPNGHRNKLGAIPVTHQSQIFTDDETDWWASSQKNDTWDEFGVTNQWNIWFYALPNLQTGTYEIGASSSAKIYPPDAVKVKLVDEASGEPSDAKPGTVTFGSFLQTDRVGDDHDVTPEYTSACSAPLAHDKISLTRGWANLFWSPNRSRTYDPLANSGEARPLFAAQDFVSVRRK